jgi:hypothetical protein
MGFEVVLEQRAISFAKIHTPIARYPADKLHMLVDANGASLLFIIIAHSREDSLTMLRIWGQSD